MSKWFTYQVTDAIELDVAYTPIADSFDPSQVTAVIDEITYNGADVKDLIFDLIPFEAASISNMAVLNYLDSQDFLELDNE